jgi:hypothetical protein
MLDQSINGLLDFCILMPTPDSNDGAPLNRYYLILFQDGDSEFGNLDRLPFQFVQQQLTEKIETPAAQNRIDVWLESPGGSASVAYKFILELRSFCQRLCVVVPDYAKSAATLLTIGADEIFMAAAAELGPLDAQIEHPSREGVGVSALDVANAFDFLGQFARDYAITGGGAVFQWIRLTRTDVLREFLRFTARFLEPAVEQLDPHLIHKATNQLELAHKYAEIVLNRRNLDPDDVSEKFDSRGFADHLVRHYPAHEFVISRDEAKAHGLPVRNIEDYDKVG